MRCAFSLLACSLAALVACTPEEIDTGTPDAGTTGGTDAGVTLDGPALLGGHDCDPLVPTQCGFPFPSNVYLADDPGLPSGKKVRFAKTALPKHNKNQLMDRSMFETRDGFSPAGFCLAHLPGATVEGLPNEDTLEVSVSDTSPTLLIEAETGRKVPHIAELDMTTDDEEDRTFIIRAVEQLRHSTRYIVAIRNVKDASGAALLPSPVFAALRDGAESDDPTVAPRRALYEDIFGKLDAAGIDKSDLQLAWDFTTASKENTTGWLVHMRDEALDLVGEDGPAYTITSVTENPNEHIARRIEGTFEVPLYLTQANVTQGDDEKYVAGRLLFGEDGMPEPSGTATYPFIVQVPNSVAADPGQPILQQGHGLLGSRNEGRNGYFARLADEKKYVTVAVDLIGMADEDEDAILDWLTADMGQFQASVDRQHQGHVNQLIAMRMMMSESFRGEEALTFDGRSAIDPSRRYYRGDSQGGIMGAVYMALSKDVERGYLGEPGMPYSLLLNRSVDFDDFLVVLRPTYNPSVADSDRYGNERNVQQVLGLLQLLWDRTEPSGWASYVTADTVTEDTPAKRILMGAALGDYQVTPLGAHVMARAMGAVHLVPGHRTIFGLDESEGPLTEGSALQEFDFGLPKVPVTNTPPRPPDFPDGQDPHDDVRKLAATFDATDAFLRNGEIRNFCVEECDPE